MGVTTYTDIVANNGRAAQAPEPKIEDWEAERLITGDERNSLTGYGMGGRANDRARNAERGVEMLIKEVIKLRQEIDLLKNK
jgi:hypothetical protein